MTFGIYAKEGSKLTVFGHVVERGTNLTVFGLDGYVRLNAKFRLLLRVGQMIIWALRIKGDKQQV